MIPGNWRHNLSSLDNLCLRRGGTQCGASEIYGFCPEVQARMLVIIVTVGDDVIVVFVVVQGSPSL